MLNITGGRNSQEVYHRVVICALTERVANEKMDINVSATLQMVQLKTQISTSYHTFLAYKFPVLVVLI